MRILGGKARAKNARRFRAAADEFRAKGDWVAAAQSYKAYLDLQPDNAGIWVQYGHALKESGDQQGAEGAYREAISLSPDVADTHVMLGHLKKISGDLAQAAQHYADAVKRAPDDLDARLQLAFAEKDLGRFDLALENFRAAHQIDPANNEAAEMIGFLSEKASTGTLKAGTNPTALSGEVEELRSAVRALAFELQRLSDRYNMSESKCTRLETEIDELREERSRSQHEITERMIHLESQTPELSGRFQALIDHIDATVEAKNSEGVR